MGISTDLAGRAHASAANIGTSCHLTATEIRGRLVMLESQRLIAGRRDLDASSTAPSRVFVLTGEGRRAAGISDTRLTTA